MLLVYTHSNTERLSYTMNLVFAEILGIPFQITEDIIYFQASTQPKMAYTNPALICDVYLESGSVLFETDIKPEPLKSCGSYLGFPVFFKAHQNSFLPYDLFATVFYFVTRYEEYGSDLLDKHQRFKAEESLAAKHHFLKIPFLHYLIEDFALKLQIKFPLLVFKKRAFNFLSTIDIDNAFAYAGKGFLRNAAGLIKDVISLNWQEVKLRIAGNMDLNKDPYNTYDLINSISRENKSALRYFILIGDYSGYDKNPHFNHKKFRNLIKNLSCHFEIGLHPSYESYNQPEKIKIEKERLEEIIQKPVTSARCHFLRVKFPDTYRRFISLGITDDYTMIFASQCGFRTGLCVPYRWFDLENNKVTSLIIHTSVIMEGVLRDYNYLNINEAELEIESLLQEVKRFGGEFVSIYHNDSFTPSNTDWVNLYKLLHLKAK